MADLTAIEGLTFDAVLGSSRTSVVWRAQHLDHDVPVAVKLATDVRPGTLAAFARELDALQRAGHHPNLVSLIDHGEVSGYPYLVVNEAPGGSLADRLASGPIHPDAALQTLLGVLDAITHLHDLGIVHGDVNPQNVLLRADGDPMLADLGSAIYADDGGSPPRAAALTLDYAAPEVLVGSPCNQAADLYSVGVLAARLLTGEHLFPRHPDEEELAYVRRRIAIASPPAVPPSSFDNVLQALLHPVPSTRPSAQEALASFRGDNEVTRRDVPAIESAGQNPRDVRRSDRSRRRLLRAGTLIAAAVIGVTSFGTTVNDTPIPERSTSTSMTQEPALSDRGEVSSPSGNDLTEPQLDAWGRPHFEHGMAAAVPRKTVENGVRIDRFDLDGDPFHPVPYDDGLWVVTTKPDGTQLQRVDLAHAALTSDTPLVGAVDGPVIHGDELLVPALEDDELSVMRMSARTGEELGRVSKARFPDDATAWAPIVIGPSREGDSTELLVPLRWSFTTLDLDGALEPSRAPDAGPVLLLDDLEGRTVLAFAGDGRLLMGDLLERTSDQLILRTDEHGTRHQVLHRAPDGSVWIVGPERTVTRIDVRSFEVTAVASAGPCPEQDELAGCRFLPPAGHGVVAHESFWVGNDAEGALYRIGLADPTSTRRIDLGAAGLGTPVATHDAVWIVDHITGSFARIDPATEMVTHDGQLPCSPAPCTAWPQAVDWRHRPVADDEAVLVPWQGALFRLSLD